LLLKDSMSLHGRPLWQLLLCGEARKEWLCLGSLLVHHHGVPLVGSWIKTWLLWLHLVGVERAVCGVLLDVDEPIWFHRGITHAWLHLWDELGCW